jgi:hypothetical protein
MKYNFEIGSDYTIHISSLMKIGSGIQVILRFCLRNLKGCNGGITNGKDFMKYAVEMGSGAMTYVSSFIEIDSGIQKLLRGIHIQTHRQQCDIISLFLFFQNKESMPINSE